MIALSDLLARMQSQTTGCVALLVVDLREGRVKEWCGDATNPSDVARVMRELLSPQDEETILLADEHTYVCRRLNDPPHHALTAICRGTRSLGFIVGLLHQEIA